MEGNVNDIIQIFHLAAGALRDAGHGLGQDADNFQPVVVKFYVFPDRRTITQKTGFGALAEHAYRRARVFVSSFEKRSLDNTKIVNECITWLHSDHLWRVPRWFRQYARRTQRAPG